MVQPWPRFLSRDLEGCLLIKPSLVAEAVPAILSVQAGLGLM